MTRRQLRHRTSKAYTSPPETGSFQQRLRQVHERGVKAQPIVVCNPLSKPGDGSKKLPDLLAEDLEPQLRDAAVAAYGRYKCSAGKTDKSGMNALNHLFTRAGGDRAMEVYWEELAMATALTEAAIGSDGVGLPLIRVNPISDEGILILAGRDLSPAVTSQFDKSWRMARNSMDLASRTYTVKLPNGHGEVVLDLEAASKVLRYRGMITGARFSLSRPTTVPRQGTFLQETLRRLANDAVSFFSSLPAMVQRFDGVAEVDTRFESNLYADGVESRPYGCFAEVKYDISPIVAAFRRAIPDMRINGTLIRKGTRKGFAEAFSGRGGMRLLNTALGEARANEYMTPITHGMYDLTAGVLLNPLKPGLVRVKRLETDPVNGNYLQYHTNIELDEDPVGRIMTALRRRTAHLPFEPSVMVIDAKDTKVRDVRARFILNSLGMEKRPVEDLAKMDFFVNFMEHVKRSIQEDIFTKMGLSEEQKDNIESLRYVLEKRRTVRDIEDLVWILRNDEDLPARIRDKAGKLESFAVEFSTENYDDMFTLLTTKILDERVKRIGRKKFIAVDGYREGQVA